MAIYNNSKSCFVFENSRMKEFSNLIFVVPGKGNLVRQNIFQFETVCVTDHVFIRISLTDSDVSIDLGDVGEAFCWQLDDSNLDFVIKNLNKLIDTILNNPCEIITVSFLGLCHISINIPSFGCYKYWILFSFASGQRKKFDPWIKSKGSELYKPNQ